MGTMHNPVRMDAVCPNSNRRSEFDECADDDATTSSSSVDVVRSGTGNDQASPDMSPTTITSRSRMSSSSSSSSSSDEEYGTVANDRHLALRDRSYVTIGRNRSTDIDDDDGYANVVVVVVVVVVVAAMAVVVVVVVVVVDGVVVVVFVLGGVEG
jgi:hypothetical protein